MNVIKVIFILLCFNFSVHSQVLSKKHGQYTQADSLRGGLRPERTDFDVLKYDLHVKVIPEKQFISGVNNISFKALNPVSVIQLDLFENMNIDSIVYQQKQLDYQRKHNAVFISFEEEISKNTQAELKFYYSGNPIVAKNPPWDGGFIFTTDKNGKDWISVAVQGTGASLWYPNKDHLSDEPEEAEIHVEVPDGLMNVSNGRFTGKKELGNGFTRWSWKVTNPINNYNIILNIGDYVHFSDTYNDLDMEYYVLSYNLEKAQKQFEEVHPMMECFYDKFGEYPFSEDSYKLVETPYLGMEHQSAVAYGNAFANGYMGNDLSGTGIGLKWDYILVHESAHEWFGNSITAADIADLWIHEAFTSYAEAVYIECRWGKEKALRYLYGTRQTMVENKSPVIGNYGVNAEGSGDMYYKGANMINTLRSLIDDDEKWWKLLKKFNIDFKHKITNTKEVIRFFEKESELELSSVFDQYLNYSKLPEIQFKEENGKLIYRWEAEASDFTMPLDIFIAEKPIRITPTQSWKTLINAEGVEDIRVDELRFYVDVVKIK